MKLTALTSSDKTKLQQQTLAAKITIAEEIIAQICRTTPQDKWAVAWTGGKDSTLLLWLVRKVCRQLSMSLPQIVFIDEGDIFAEVKEFVDDLAWKWNLKVDVAHNNDVSNQVKKIGDVIQVSNLNRRNRQELKKLGFKDQSFPYQPESLVGNHLMKTVAFNIWLEKQKTELVMTGVRWDEQAARSEDDFVRRIDQPAHSRVEPILHFLEKDIWQAIHLGFQMS